MFASVFFPLKGQEYVFIHKDGQSLDYISKDEVFSTVTISPYLHLMNSHRLNASPNSNYSACRSTKP